MKNKAFLISFFFYSFSVSIHQNCAQERSNRPWKIYGATGASPSNKAHTNQLPNEVVQTVMDRLTKFNEEEKQKNHQSLFKRAFATFFFGFTSSLWIEHTTDDSATQKELAVKYTLVVPISSSLTVFTNKYVKQEVFASTFTDDFIILTSYIAGLLGGRIAISLLRPPKSK